MLRTRARRPGSKRLEKTEHHFLGEAGDGGGEEPSEKGVTLEKSHNVSDIRVEEEIWGD